VGRVRPLGVSWGVKGGADLFDPVVPHFACDAHVEYVIVLRDDGAAELFRRAEVFACLE
jgi:hypothetical protein